MTHIELKNKIMMRVYMLYAFRRLQEPFVAETVLLFASFGLLFFSVSVSHIIANFAILPHNFFAFSNFAFVAIRDTRLTVQVLLLSLAVAGGIFVRDFVSLYAGSPRGIFKQILNIF